MGASPIHGMEGFRQVVMAARNGLPNLPIVIQDLLTVHAKSQRACRGTAQMLKVKRLSQDEWRSFALAMLEPSSIVVEWLWKKVIAGTKHHPEM